MYNIQLLTPSKLWITNLNINMQRFQIKISLADVIFLIKSAWNSIIPDAIRKRFKSVGLSKAQYEQNSAGSFDSDNEISESENCSVSEEEEIISRENGDLDVDILVKNYQEEQLKHKDSEESNDIIEDEEAI